jgi:hypothetical protein
MSQNIPHKMHLTPLPGSTWKTLSDSGYQPLIGIGNHPRGSSSPRLF